MARNLVKTIRSLHSNTFGYSTNHYGHEYIIRKYLGFPQPLPFNIRIQHGWYSQLSYNTTDFKREQPRMWVWNTRIMNEWKKMSDVPVDISGSPFMLYRRMMNIRKKENSKGTVVFPQHSTRSNEQVFDLDEYCNELKDLSDEFQPITICLLFRDYDTYGPVFMKHGFKIVSAGHSRQRRGGFVKRFYQILSEHKYASSNDMSTSGLYAVEMDIPFFIYGPIPIQRKKATGVADPTNEVLVEMRKLFDASVQQITAEQRKIVDFELGVNDSLERDELKSILVNHLLYCEVPQYPKRIMNSLMHAVGRDKLEW